MRRIEIDGARILDWVSFHGVFAEAFDFPPYYGKNMDAWIDCMSDEVAGNTVLVDLRHAENFRERLPDIFNALVECCGFVNLRYADAEESRLYLAFI